eukprot:403346149
MLQQMLQNYRGMIQELTKIEKKINNIPRLFKGKTINLSNRQVKQPRAIGENKRSRTRDPLDASRTRSSYPKHINEYARLIAEFQRIKMDEEHKEQQVYFAIEEQLDKAGWYNNIFFKSNSMHENFMTYRDVVFINKRLAKTRYNRILLVFYGINSNGKSVIFSICFIHKEDEENYEFAISNFKKALCDDVNPKIFIIERNSSLKTTIQKQFSNQMRVLFCFDHYQKSIRHYFDNAKGSQQKYLSKALQLLEPLPQIEDQRYFESQMDELKKEQQEYANNNDKLFQLLDKIHNERNSWARVQHLQNFTGAFKVCERNEVIKNFMYHLINRKDTPIEETARILSKSDCIKHPTHCFEEFKLVKLNQLEEIPFVADYIRENLTNYANNRIRNSIAIGFKDYRITRHDKMTKVYIVERIEKIYQDGVFNHQKLKVINNHLFCTCLDYFHSGLPCSHQLLSYEKIMFDMDESSRCERIDKIYEQFVQEFKMVYGLFSKMTAKINVNDFNLQCQTEVKKQIMGSFGRSPFKQFKSSNKSSTDKFMKKFQNQDETQKEEVKNCNDQNEIKIENDQNQKQPIQPGEGDQVQMKYEFGFREKSKIKKFKGGKKPRDPNAPKKEKLQIINIGGGGQKSKEQNDEEKGAKKKKQQEYKKRGRKKKGMYDDDDDIQEQKQPDVTEVKVVEKVSLDNLLKKDSVEKKLSVSELLAKKKLESPQKEEKELLEQNKSPKKSSPRKSKKKDIIQIDKNQEKQNKPSKKKSVESKETKKSKPSRRREEKLDIKIVTKIKQRQVKEDVLDQLKNNQELKDTSEPIQQLKSPQKSLPKRNSPTKQERESRNPNVEVMRHRRRNGNVVIKLRILKVIFESKLKRIRDQNETETENEEDDEPYNASYSRKSPPKTSMKSKQKKRQKHSPNIVDATFDQQATFNTDIFLKEQPTQIQIIENQSLMSQHNLNNFDAINRNNFLLNLQQYDPRRRHQQHQQNSAFGYDGNIQNIINQEDIIMDEIENINELQTDTRSNLDNQNNDYENEDQSTCHNMDDDKISVR